MTDIETLVKRNTTVEMLRLFFMYLIVVIHVFLHGYNLEYESIFSLGKHISTIFHFEMVMLGKLGVIGFIFISGYYGINFSIKKLLNLVVTIGFYLLILQLITRSSLLAILYYIFHPYDYWWFIQYYLVLFVLSPIINEGWIHLSKKVRRFLIGCLLYFFCVGLFVLKKDSHDMMTMIVVYLFARSIHDEHFNKQKLYIVSIISLFLYLIVPLVLVNLTPSYNKYVFTWFSYNNILLLFIAAGIVVWADHKKTYNRYINIAASSVLAIYLITDWSQIRYWDNLMLPYMFEGWGYLYCAVVCCICIVFDKVRISLFSIIERFISSIIFIRHSSFLRR